MALDPSALEAGQDASPAAADSIAPAVEPAAKGQEPSATQEPAKPATYTAEEWFASPEYQSRKDKELAQLQANWRKQEAERITAQASQAERQRAEAEHADLVRRAYEQGDLEAQAKLSQTAYHQLIEQGAKNGTIAALGQQYESYVSKLTAGDEAAKTRLDYRQWNDAQAWLDAVSDYRVAKEADTRAEALAEAKLASQRATGRDTKPNPDTAEMVGGHGGPVASLSLEELNTRYAKAKDDGNSEEVARLKSVLHRRAPVMAGGRR